MNGKLPTFVDCMSSEAARLLIEVLSVPRPQAERLGIDIAAAVCEQHRGCSFFVPKFAAHQLDRRDRQIAEAYGKPGPNGTQAYTAQRIRQLSQEYGLSSVQIYCILARQRRFARRAPGQTDDSGCRSVDHAST